MNNNFDFYGAFKISPKLNKKQVEVLESLLYKNRSDLPGWVSKSLAKDLEYAPLETDGKYIVWNGEQCSADMEEALIALINAMAKRLPKFSLKGIMVTQCADDILLRWHIVCAKGSIWAERAPLPKGLLPREAVENIYKRIHGG